MCRPAGANPARPRVSPPEPVASLAPFLETSAAMRRQANVRAVGLRPRNLYSSRMPRVLESFEGHNSPLRESLWARRGLYPAGCSTRARTKRTIPYPGRPSPPLDESRRGGEPVSRLRRTTRMRAHVSSALWGTEHASASREVTARGTGAVADGGRESEGCIGAMRSGNGVASGTRRSKGGPC